MLPPFFTPGLSWVSNGVEALGRASAASDEIKKGALEGVNRSLHESAEI